MSKVCIFDDDDWIVGCKLVMEAAKIASYQRQPSSKNDASTAWLAHSGFQSFCFSFPLVAGCPRIHWLLVTFYHILDQFIGCDAVLSRFRSLPVAVESLAMLDQWLHLLVDGAIDIQWIAVRFRLWLLVVTHRVALLLSTYLDLLDGTLREDYSEEIVGHARVLDLDFELPVYKTTVLRQKNQSACDIGEEMNKNVNVNEPAPATRS